MPLIKCPMCEKMISPNAATCPNCGEPMKENNINESNMFDVVLTNSGNRKINVIKKIREIIECELVQAKNIVDNAPSIIISNVDYENAQKIKKILNQLDAEVEILSKGKFPNLNEIKIKKQINIENIIECPNCKSANVHKISGLSKASSVAMFGIFSIGKLNKTYECKKCKYRW